MISVETQKNSGKSHLKEIYECQRCGEVKRIYELTTWTIHSPSQYSRQEGLKEIKEPMEFTVRDVPVSQRTKIPEKQKEKKKGKWL